MGFKDLPVKQAKLPETAQIWDVTDREFVTAYRADFRRQKTVFLINSIIFNNVISSFTGGFFEVPAYKDALIMVDLAVANAPTDIVIDIEFSFDKIRWFKYIIGPFGDLRFEDAAGDKQECLEIPVMAPYIRSKATATGTTASATFKLSVIAILNG